MANVKAIYLDSNGVFRPAGSSDTIDVGDIKLLNQTTANGVLSTNSSGEVSSALLTNNNVASNAAIAGTKVSPNFGAQNVQTTGSVTADSFSGDLNADDLASGTVPSARVSGSYTGITGVGTISTGVWQGTQISDTYLAQITTANKVANSATTAASANTPSAIVARDASGDFSAGMITANLTGAVTGNADTASKWATARNIGFSGGDVSGTVSSLDGSANINNVSLTIGAGKVTTSKIENLAVTNAKLAGEITDDKLLSGVSSNNDASTIVKRDASGNFSAGSISASLDGNAATSSKWFASRSIGFAGGDVTGTISGLDGSADISNVALTIGSAKVTNDMLAGSIADSKLNTISTAGKVADSALSSNIAQLDRNGQAFTGTTPSFSNALSVGTPTQASHATTKTYVDDAVAAATAGLDYKQEAQWYNDLAQFGGTKANFLSMVNSLGGSAPFAAGDRILLNDSAAPNVDVGIYVFAGSAGSFTLPRASDYAAGTSATGAWIYCLQRLGGSPPAPIALNTAYVCPTQANVGQAIQFVVYAAGQTYTGVAPVVVTGTAISLDSGNGLEVSASKLVVKPNAASAVSVSASGVAVDVDETSIQISANKIAFKSLPLQFKINGSATSADVTAANLGTLTVGPTGNATLLHRHEMVLNALDRDSGQAAFDEGTPVISNSSGKLVRASSSVGKCLGVVYSDESGSVLMASAGLLSVTGSLWTSSAPANGEAVYLGDSGKLAKYSDLSSGDYVTKIGRLVSGSKLAIAIQDVGVKP